MLLRRGRVYLLRIPFEAVFVDWLVSGCCLAANSRLFMDVSLLLLSVVLHGEGRISPATLRNQHSKECRQGML